MMGGQLALPEPSSLERPVPAGLPRRDRADGSIQTNHPFAAAIAMIAGMVAPASDVVIDAGPPERQANGYTGRKLAAKRAGGNVI